MRRSPLSALALTAFVDMLGFSIIIPILPYYAEAYGASAHEIGLLFASYSLMQFIFAPIWGSISDRIGRKPVLLIGLFGASIGFIIFGMAPDLATLFLSRLFAGAMAATIPVALAYVADVTEPAGRARAMGFIGASVGVGFVMGPAIGGTLEQAGHGVPAFVAAGLALANALWTAFVLKESLHPDMREERWFPLHALRVVVHSKVVMLTFAVYFVSLFAFAAMEATFALLVQDFLAPGLTHAQLARRVGYLLGYSGVVIVLVQGGVLGRLVKAFGEGRLIPLGFSLMAIGLIMLPQRAGPGWVLATLTMLAGGSALIRPTVSSVLSQTVSASVQGGVLSISQALGSLARATGPTWGGWVYQEWGYPAPFLLGGAIMLCALGGALVLYMLLPPHIRTRRSIEPTA